MADTDPPVFLSKMEKPPGFVYHAFSHYKAKVYELLVTEEALLEINDAAEQLLECVQCYHTLVWLSRHTFITKSWARRSISHYDLEISTLLHRDSDFYLCLFHCSPKDVDKNEAYVHASWAEIGRAMNLLLRLFAKHKTITEIVIRQGGGCPFNAPFPVALDVLKGLVHMAPGPRVLRVEYAGLTNEQWRVVCFHCNNNVTLLYRDCHTEVSKFKVLIEAMKANKCPTNLQLLAFNDLPLHIAREIIAALEFAKSMKYLELRHIHQDSSVFTLVCETISKIRELPNLYLSVYCPKDSEGLTLSDTQWEIVCTALASHPSLQSLKFHGRLAPSSRSRERDELLIQHLSRNTVLSKFTPIDCLHNPEHVQETLRPFLQMNRFRQVMKTAKRETDGTRRQNFLTTILLSDQVSKSPAYRFFLFKENPDLLRGIIII